MGIMDWMRGKGKGKGKQWKDPERGKTQETKAETKVEAKEAEKCSCGHDHGHKHEDVPKAADAAVEAPPKEKKAHMKENVMPGTPPPPAEPEAPPVLGPRDYRKLANNDYEKAKEKFKTVFVIQHVKTKKVAELRAASVVHAANLIGWRPRQVRLVKSYEEK